MSRLARNRHSFGGLMQYRFQGIDTASIGTGMSLDKMSSLLPVPICNYHLQFTPKYRRVVFENPEVQAVCRMAILEKAARLNVTVGALEFGPEHIHVFVQDCRNYSVSYLVGQLKGFSSYTVRRQCWNIVKKYLWGDHFWTPGYFYESVGRVTDDMVKFYITRQQKKHWQGDDYEYFNVHTALKSKGQATLMDFAM